MSHTLYLSPPSTKFPTCTPLSLSLYTLSRISHASSRNTDINIIFAKNAPSYHVMPMLCESRICEDQESLPPKYALPAQLRSIYDAQTHETLVTYDYFEILHVLEGFNAAQHSSEPIQHLAFIYHRLLPLVYFHHLYYPSKNYYSYIVPSIQRAMSSLWGQISTPHRTRKAVKERFAEYWSSEQFSKGLGFNSELFVSRLEMRLILSHVNEMVTDAQAMRDERLRSLVYGCLALIYYVDMPKNDLRNMLRQFPKLISFVQQCTEQYMPQRYMNALVAATIDDAASAENEESESLHSYIAQELNNREEEQYKKSTNWVVAGTVVATIVAWVGMNKVF